MTTSTRSGYCTSPSCSRIGDRETQGLCLMHALRAGFEVTCPNCSQPFKLSEFFPNIRCAC